MVLEALPLGVYVVNRVGKITLWSAGAEALSGYPPQEVLGRLREEELWEQQPSDADNPLMEEEHPAPVGPLRDPQPTQSHLSLRTKAGGFVPVELHSVPLRDDNGRILGTAKVFKPICGSEISGRRQNRLGAFGALDPPTGLLNHSMIQAHLRDSLSLHALYPVPFLVVCCAVDDLPKLRERYGQAAVDGALRMGAQNHRERPITDRFVGRWLGEEFLAILPECGEADVMKVGERLNKLIQRSACTGGRYASSHNFCWRDSRARRRHG